MTMTSAWPTILNELVKANTAKSAASTRKTMPNMNSSRGVCDDCTARRGAWQRESAAQSRIAVRILQRGCAASLRLLRMCLILAIVEVVIPSTTPRRSVYGDQGQEVAWEVACK